MRETGRRTIAITGCSRGLGRALVDEFVAAGHTVAGCSRSATAMQALSTEYPGAHHFRAVDVSDDAAVENWSNALVEKVGVPDLVISNAAIINDPLPLWEVPASDFRHLVDINITGTFHVCRHLLPRMIEEGRGVLVNLSSGWGRSVSTEVAPYCASKWAIEGMTRALAEELPAGLAAVPLNPGVIDTDMLRQTWGAGAAGFGTAARWAKTAAPFLLSLDASHNGQPLTAPG